MKSCVFCLPALLFLVVLSVANESKQVSYLAKVQDAYSSKFLKQARGLGLTVWPLSLAGWFEIRVSKAKTKHKSPDHTFWKRTLNQLPGILSLEEQHEKKISLRQGLTTPNETLWQNGSMWYWRNTSSMHVQQVWESGYKGTGIQIAIIDDGVDHRNQEFQGRFNFPLSFDYTRRTPDARPAYGQTHGTKVAGVAAGALNNGFCGAGAAPKATLVGVRLISYSGSTTPSNEAESLTGMNRYESTHLYVASWGAVDDGKTLDGPAQITKDAMEKAATEGSRGKGSLLIFAAGNGGANTDDCMCDGYVTNKYTIAVQAVNRDGSAPYYTEPCAAAVTSVYVDDGLVAPLPIAFTPSCSLRFAGTSAAAPAAAGILALALEDNPDLTRRSLLDLVVQASDPTVLDPNGWIFNGTNAGYKFHPRFGFGLLDAQKLKELVHTWDTTSYSEKEIDVTGNCAAVPCTRTVFDVNITRHGTVEQLSITLNLSPTKTRGDIELFIKSPSTRIPILNKRPLDTDVNGFKDWEFSTVAFWGEHPNGVWELEVKNAKITIFSPLTFTYRERLPEATITPGPEGLSIGAIRGITCAVVGLLLCAGSFTIFLIIFIFRKRKSVEDEKKHPTEPKEDTEEVAETKTYDEAQKTDPIFVSHR